MTESSGSDERDNGSDSTETVVRNIVGGSQWWGTPRPWWSITTLQRTKNQQEENTEDSQLFLDEAESTTKAARHKKTRNSRGGEIDLETTPFVNSGAMAAAASSIEQQHKYLSKHSISSPSISVNQDPTISSVFQWSSPGSVPKLPWIPTALQGQPPVEVPKDPFEVMNSCPAKTVLSFVMGGALGVATGIVVGGFQSSSPPMGYPGAPPPPSMTAIEALKDTGEMMMNKSKSWSKNFAKVGAIYSTVECVLEKGRAQHDMQNSVYAGCITGAALAYKQGPLAMAMGCGGFAAFSVAIEMFFPGH